MNPVNRLKLQILRDEIQEHFQNCFKQAEDVVGRHKNRVSPSPGEIIQETEGRIWVQVGKKGHKIRVTHLHPANPAVAQALREKVKSSSNLDPNKSEDLYEQSVLTPDTDNDSELSLEDYWFNHWQGPPICPNNNHPNIPSHLRNSIRKSRRKSRCGVCQRKVAGNDGDQSSTNTYVEPEQDVLAHVPSVKPEIIVALEDFDLKDEEETNRLVTNEDALSRTSITDEHGIPTVANRVIDNELRTSLSLFSGEGICQDVVDSSFCEPKESIHVDTVNPLPQKGTPKSKLGQSRSCPCTPELPRAMSVRGSPKTHRKTSMSCSLLAIPKQESSFKSGFDLQKSDSASCCQSSRRSSQISVQKKTNQDQKEIVSSSEDLCNEPGRNQSESHNPPLRLSKMSITFKTNPISEGQEVQRTENFPEVLPDLVTGAPQYAGGFLNLGFDGTGESSDYFEEPVISEGPKSFCSLDLGQAHAVSIGHESQSVQYSLSVEPDTGIVTQDLPSIDENTSKTDAKTADEIIEEVPLPTEFEGNDFWNKCRASIYWWRNSEKQHQGAEFCHNELECLTEQKPLIFFIHGVGSSSDIWTQQMWYFLSCGYEVVAPDMFGHGLSSAPDDPKHYTFSRMLDYIGLAFDLFVPHGRKCVVVGHNYGSALAVAFSRGRQFCVALTVLISCGGPNPLVPYSNDESVLDSKLVRFVQPLITCGCLSRDLMYQPRGKHYQPSKGTVPSAPNYVIRHLSKGQVWPEGDITFHRRITVPTLILYGMKDQNVTLVEMCEMEKAIPRAFLSYVSGAGHDLPIEASKEVCLSIHKFIKRWKHLLSP